LDGYFEGYDFDYYCLTDSKEKKILKKDITLDFTLLDDYDYVILVGAEPAKFIAQITSVIKVMGTLVKNKWLPIANPKTIKFNPANAAPIENAITKIKSIINGTVCKADISTYLIQNEDEITKLCTKIRDFETIALDTETTGLYPRDGYVLGISVTMEDNIGYYLDADYITEDHIAMLQEYCNTHYIIFHNAKFDIHMLNYHFGLVFPYFEDTMMIHYCLNEQPGTHGLKDLAIKYTDLGDYDSDLTTYKKEYCKKRGVKVGDFTYDLIPFDILGKYAAIDTIAAFKIFKLFRPKVTGKVEKVYKNLLIDGIVALLIVEDNGVPFSEEQLQIEKHNLDTELNKLQNDLYTFDVIHKYEKDTGNIFNTNSVIHKRTILFDMLKLKGPGKKTGTGAMSVDAEVMEFLAPQHDLPNLMLKISKLRKIKTTYIDKIIVSLDADSRLRTNFNLHTTTSGRLSSSGKLNMQQLPRDNKAPKRCIKARNGWKIVSGDLGTAEMWCVAAMSGDPVLQGIFKNKEDYHSMIAKYKFDLPYTDKEIKEFHSDLRQAAKTTSFEILYKLNQKEDYLTYLVPIEKSGHMKYEVALIH